MANLRQRISGRAMRDVIRLGEGLIRHAARDGRRAYFDMAQFPWNRRFELEWSDIRAELDTVLRERAGIHPFQVVSEEQHTVTTDDKWRVFMFYIYGTPIEASCRRCPRTAELLATIPGLRNAMFSILAPGKRIPPHRGVYNGLLRMHLALKVPVPGDTCVIEVAGEERHWTEGRTLVFDDTLLHSVNNDTDQERVVLFADFERPLAWPLAAINKALIAYIGTSPLFRVPLEKFQRGEL